MLSKRDAAIRNSGKDCSEGVPRISQHLYFRRLLIWMLTSQ
jgi:hypothetical protein